MDHGNLRCRIIMPYPASRSRSGCRRRRAASITSMCLHVEASSSCPGAPQPGKAAPLRAVDMRVTAV
jgi:hypothetical protein